MLQAVKSTDPYASQLFQWDSEEQVLSLPYGEEIWFARLREDGNFEVIDHKPKSQFKRSQNS